LDIEKITEKRGFGHYENVTQLRSIAVAAIRMKDAWEWGEAADLTA
jgi:hypothetical protein